MGQEVSAHRAARELSDAANEGDVDRLRALFAAGVSPDTLSVTDEDEDEGDEDDYEPDVLQSRVVVSAAHGDNVAVLQAFIEAGAKLDELLGTTTRRFADPTPFIAALVNGGADPDEPDREGIPPLIAAAAGPWVALQAVTALLDHGAEINARDTEGGTALHAAISNAGGNLEVVQVLVARGIDVDATNNAGLSAFAYAQHCRQQNRGQLDEILALLRDAGVETGSGVPSRDGVVDALRRLQQDRPARIESLGDAARTGDAELVRAFLADGQHPDEPYREGFYPVEVAHAAGHPAIVALLLAAGAQPRTPPPIDPAADARARRNRQLLAELTAEHETSLDRVENETDRAALEHDAAASIRGGALGAEPATVKVGDEAILSFAAEHGLAVVVDALLELGLPVDGADGEQQHPPLLIAARRGHGEICRALLAAGADPSLSRDDRLNTLAAAATSGDPDLVERLLNAGADLGYVGPAGQTASNLAAGPQRNAIRRLLRERRRELSLKARAPAVVSKRRKRMYDPSDLHGMEAYAGYVPSPWPRWAVRATADDVCASLEAGTDPVAVQRQLGKSPMLAAHRFAVVFQVQGSAWSLVSEMGTVPAAARQRVMAVATHLQSTGCWYTHALGTGMNVDVVHESDAAWRPIDAPQIAAWFQEVQLWVPPHHIDADGRSESGWHNQLRLHGLRTEQLVVVHRIVWQW